MNSWHDDFKDAALKAWQQVDMELPDVLPYYPERPVNRAAWTAGDGVLEVESRANAWSYLLRGNAQDMDGALEFEMMMPFFTPDRVEVFGMNVLSYRPGEFEPCWETAAVVRYLDRDRFYRVQFGWLAGGTEQGPGGCVALWSPDGGFLQVAPWSPAPFRYQAVRVVTRGETIAVWVDGELKIHYRDTVAPVASGRCGLAAAGVRFYRFRNARCAPCPTSLPPGQAVCAGQQPPVFHLRTFLRQTFLFCNDEPIGSLDKNTSILGEVRLRPGYRPLTRFGLHWDQYNSKRHFVDVPEEWVVEKTGGPEFVLRYRFRNIDGNVRCNGRLTVSLDRERDTYCWGIDTTVEVAEGHTWLNEHYGLSFADPVPYAIVPPAVDVQDPWPAPYEWIVFESPDGTLYRHPLFHNHVPRVEDQMRIRSDGGFAALIGSAPANPALEFDFRPEPGLRPAFWLCPWIYDIHFLINPYENGYRIPAGTRHRVKFRYLSVHGDRAQSLLRASQVHPYFEQLPERVPFRLGVNTFAKTVRCDVPHREYPWTGGVRDTAVGRSDSFSMRLENGDPETPARLSVAIGGSNFMGRFRNRRYRITGWVRTDSVSGRGAALFARNGSLYAYSGERLAGTGEWRELRLDTEILYAILMGEVGLELDGTGTVWLDDFELAPLD